MEARPTLRGLEPLLTGLPSTRPTCCTSRPRAVPAARADARRAGRAGRVLQPPRRRLRRGPPLRRPAASRPAPSAIRLRRRRKSRWAASRWLKAFDALIFDVFTDKDAAAYAAALEAAAPADWARRRRRAASPVPTGGEEAAWRAIRPSRARQAAHRGGGRPLDLDQANNPYPRVDFKHHYPAVARYGYGVVRPWGSAATSGARAVRVAHMAQHFLNMRLRFLPTDGYAHLRALASSFGDDNTFVWTSNVDGAFERAGFPPRPSTRRRARCAGCSARPGCGHVWDCAACCTPSAADGVRRLALPAPPAVRTHTGPTCAAATGATRRRTPGGRGWRRGDEADRRAASLSSRWVSGPTRPSSRASPLRRLGPRGGRWPPRLPARQPHPPERLDETRRQRVLLPLAPAVDGAQASPRRRRAARRRRRQPTTARGRALERKYWQERYRAARFAARQGDVGALVARQCVRRVAMLFKVRAAFALETDISARGDEISLVTDL